MTGRENQGDLWDHIHTGIFQGKIKNFPGLETPPVRSSDPTVQYSVGPMVRSYTRHVPILRTFFITEFRGSRSSGLTCKKTSKTFQGKTFQGKTFQGKTFQGKTFQGKTFQGNRKSGEGHTESVRWRRKMRRGSLPRASTRSARGA